MIQSGPCAKLESGNPAAKHNLIRIAKFRNDESAGDGKLTNSRSTTDPCNGPPLALSPAVTTQCGREIDRTEPLRAVDRKLAMPVREASRAPGY